MEALIIILTGVFIAGSCGLLGSYLVLRKMAMLSDAISHAVLPGIVLAYIVHQTHSDFLFLIGASFTGVLATYIIEIIHKRTKLQSDASIGVTYTWLFAIGVILVSLKTANVDIDQDCILYGDINYIVLDPYYLGFWKAFSNFLVVLIFVILFFKQLRNASFDEAFSKSKGFKTTKLHFFLMLMVSLTTVLSFENVGAVLVVGLMVVPPSTAYLISKKLNQMLLYSFLIGALSSFFGYFLASYLNSSIAASIVVVSGLIFLFVFIGQKVLIKLFSEHNRNKKPL